MSTENHREKAQGPAVKNDLVRLSPHAPMKNIASLIREGAYAMGKEQGSKRASTMVQRMINSLQWRQAHSKDEYYPLAMESGAELRLRQLQAGEVTGLGTGATVWPAAHVLVKYLERKYDKMGMKGLKVVDLGSGTGVAGIAAAALGASTSFLTDQEQLLFLMRENAERCSQDNGVPPEALRVVAYDWGMDDHKLSPPVDVILISDCVLPKLYPIEPLVDAIDKLSGPETVTIMSYEHRHYEAFDPRRRFEELASMRGLIKTDVPQAQHHHIFSADDIEIWEVRRSRRSADPSGFGGDGGGLPSLSSAQPEAARNSKAPMSHVDGVDILQYDPTKVVASIRGCRYELSQSLSGAIGCYLWPSGVVMARHLLASAKESVPPTSAGEGEKRGASGTSSRPYPQRATVLELGSGVGLVAIAAVLLGWDVVATDKADALPLLKSNIGRFLSSVSDRECQKLPRHRPRATPCPDPLAMLLCPATATLHVWCGGESSIG